MNPIPAALSAKLLTDGLRLQSEGRLAEARALFERVIAAEPDHAGAAQVLGLLTHREGNDAAALRWLRRSVALSPLTAEWHNNLGIVLADGAREDGRLDEALVAFGEAIRLKPDFAEAHRNLGTALRRAGRVAAAIEAVRRAIALKPDWAELFGQLARLNEEAGDADAAIEAYRRAVALRPEDRAMHSNLCLAMNYSDRCGAAEIYAEHVRWGESAGIGYRVSGMENRRSSIEDRVSTDVMPAAFPTPHTRHPIPNTRPHARLRIGYVSADFREHPRMRFLGPIVANHDRRVVEVFCYSDVTRPDSCTAKWKTWAEHWRDIAALSDEAAAAMIRADGIGAAYRAGVLAVIMLCQMPHSAALRLHPTDNVAVLKSAVRRGVEISDPCFTVITERAIAAGHKIAIEPIASGGAIRKYGQIIGFAREIILPGEHVHTHNVVTHDFDRAADACADAREIDYYPPQAMRMFPGFLRPDGKVGTRNYVAVITSVNCSASVSRYVVERFRTPEFARQFPNVDGVVAFTHKYGCGIPPGEPLEILKRVAAGLARHANIFGYVMIGLGCETNQVQFIRADHRLDVIAPGTAKPTFMNIQAMGGVSKTVDAASAAVAKLLPLANDARRSPQPISHLILATNCGGSDGNSGVTANPALGVAVDELVRYRGTAILAETPEIYGAEHLLIRRAISRGVAGKLIERIRWWENYAKMHNATIDNNPSWGNKEGGLTTIYEKSLGAVSKGGTMPLAAVYDYAEPITMSGFGFMDTPGLDPISMTGLICGGCNVGVFTTGRGSVYGCKPSPCIKVTTNTDVFDRMNDDMDLNAGTILDGTETLAQVGMRIFEKIISVAGGEKTKSELAGIGDEEFAPWMLGPQF